MSEQRREAAAFLSEMRNESWACPQERRSSAGFNSCHCVSGRSAGLQIWRGSHLQTTNPAGLSVI